ncbi:hypothetical protein EIKCOROL_01250 [Eikenella corrodens ATCC 23834]|uniref:Uncharacterized protein n=1 Tax=Eikenella corrodens ATCC 23834 TaxID=546274 RepID=C0DV61_EIKCO|nr:hypothetical protein EIKCOROL_01250 [Eikenella corrodens ATCC 23834]
MPSLTAVSDLNLLPLGQKSAWKSSCQQPQSGYLKNHLQVA